MDRSRVKEEERIPVDVQTKIDLFIQEELHLEPSKFVCLQRGVPDFLSSSTGSLQEGCRGVLLIDPKMVKAIARDFSDRLKFALGYSIAHLDLESDHFIRLKESQVAPTIEIVAYMTTLAVAHYFDYTSLPIAHLTGCIVAKTASFLWEKKVKQMLSSKADLWVAAKSQQLAAGGIALLQEFKELHSQAVKELVRFGLGKVVDLQKKNDGSWKAHGIKAFAQLACRSLMTVDGDDRFDLDHPSFTERQAKIAQYAQ